LSALASLFTIHIVCQQWCAALPFIITCINPVIVLHKEVLHKDALHTRCKRFD